MTGDGDRWAALDSQHERLVDISIPLPVIEPAGRRKLRQRRGALAAAGTELTRRSRSSRRGNRVRAS